MKEKDLEMPLPKEKKKQVQNAILMPQGGKSVFGWLGRVPTKGCQGSWRGGG